jgi:aspartyl-tRNA(Asn)/glutamyl-tRNA(Gln) amidotransferase subunit A
MTIQEFGAKLRARAMTSEAIVEQCLAQIEARNPATNAFILVMADEARRQAREADRELAEGRDRGPLHGVPVSIKDLMDVRGTETTAASRVRVGRTASQDAPCVASLRSGGAVFVGKTNLHEYALGTTSGDSAFGAVRNPLDLTRSPGGSSGGSAVSVATGMALATVGTDTGGSIRIPAACCGIVGLKPSLGEVPTEGVVPLSSTFDHVGPLAASVADAWTVFRVLTGDLAPPPLAPATAAALRLAVPRSYFLDMLDDDVRARFEASLEAFRTAGVRVREIEIPHTETIANVYIRISLKEAAAYHAATLAAVPERYTPPVRQRLEMGRNIQHEEYMLALGGREQLRRDVDAAFADCDALALPTLPIPAPKIDAETVQVGPTVQPLRNVMLRLTQLFNITGNPAISIPCGLTRDGMPCGLQIVGARGQTRELVQAALACEALLA